jgi:hypothetical protein
MNFTLGGGYFAKYALPVMQFAQAAYSAISEEPIHFSLQ